MAKKVARVALLAAVVVVVVLLAKTPATKAVNCSPLELAPCAPAFMSSQEPSNSCCAKLQEQKPCLCGYARNPTYKSYVDSPAAKRIASSCKVHVSC
ncbi:unnamed protein product [Amaranthus hypochondriacus]